VGVAGRADDAVEDGVSGIGGLEGEDIEGFWDDDIATLAAERSEPDVLGRGASGVGGSDPGFRV